MMCKVILRTLFTLYKYLKFTAHFSLLRILGIEFGSPTNDSVSLFFTSSKTLVVTGKQAIFKKVEESGQLVTLDVATDKTVVYQR